MTVRAPALGWSVLAAAAVAAAVGPLPVQLGFAVVAIGAIGMAHGASDLAIVAPGRRPLFLVAYAAVSLLCLGWWIVDPAVALPLFLLASAIHFAMEDAPQGSAMERIARGVSLVTTPATLHVTALHALLQRAAGEAGVPFTAAVAMAAAGGAAAAYLLILGLQRRQTRLLVGTVALLVLPPLVGFAVGFLILHALPQTAIRRRMIGCRSNRAYLRATAPILFAAAASVAVVAAFLLHNDPSGITALFAGIAALAMPHLLVTPFFESGHAPAGQPLPAVTRP
ncbi:Brp/Blh family beta-carotene 15,15'-dioxygenase [Sphingomonas sp. XXL09]|uniref:Brp/Blh family beta-carotene 15,15'-dioxygenase n=1 Tax=Sphingomonas sp. XXL09 TaxID=3457787 RepID=UPI00406BCF08